MNKPAAYIGLDIGGTKCGAALGHVSDRVHIEDKITFPTAGTTPDEVLARFARFIEEKLPAWEIRGIGIACGGPLDSRRGIVKKPPSLLLWDNIAVVEYFESRFGIPTKLRNDADACALAEWKYGAGAGTQSMVFLTFGTGFGAGLILNGQLWAGANDAAGEIGHVRLRQNGPEGYYKHGSCEGYCSGSGMRRLALLELEKCRKRGQEPPIVAAVGGEDNITAKTLAEQARAGDAFARRIYRISGEMLGHALSILMDVLNPERIVIGGIFMRSGELLLPHALRVIQKEALPTTREQCEILPARLSEDVGFVSALTVAAL